jgi:serine/threonine protein kinase
MHKDINGADMQIDKVDPNLSRLLKGKYEVQFKLGQGAQGNVYLGRCLADDKLVAIKVLRVNSAKDWKQYELFEREANVLKSINVPGTARFYEAIQDLDSAVPMSVIVQEYIEGRSLQSYIDKNARFSFDVLCGILIKLYCILCDLHNRIPPIIHRDIKPSNIILRYSDKSAVPDVFLIDFGAVANPQVQDGGSTVTGTYGYMAPEQLVGKPTPASDIYSFAVLAVYLFSGVPPEKIEVQDLRLLIDPHLEHLPHAVTVFLRQMLDPSPVTRLVDDSIILDTLQKFQQQQFTVGGLKTKKDSHHYKIENVMFLGQPGNLELWESLPDTTPRKLDPVYHRMLKKFDRIIGKTKGSFGSSYSFNQIHLCQREFENLLNPQTSSTDDIIARGLVVGLIVVFFGPVLLFIILLSFFIVVILLCAILRTESVNIFLSFCVWAVLLGTGITVAFYLYKENKYKRYNIFFNGRKSLAVIDRIELISVQFRSYDSRHLKMSQFLYDGMRPLWRVVYFFNPPDDNDSEPVFHTYYSDVPPVHLKKGDTLPILYQIVDKKAYSVPYPLPPHGSLFQCQEYVKLFNPDLELVTVSEV